MGWRVPGAIGIWLWRTEGIMLAAVPRREQPAMERQPVLASNGILLVAQEVAHRVMTVARVAPKIAPADQDEPDRVLGLSDRQL
jgi:hypothetical protein